MTSQQPRVLVLGATGGIGILLIRELLEKLPDSTIVVYARSPDKLPDDITHHPSLTIIKGTFQDTPSLDQAMHGVSVVLSALGPAVSKGPFHPSGCPLAQAYKDILVCMKKHDVKRIIALGTASNEDEKDRFSYKFWVLVTGVATFARTAYNDIVAIGKEIREGGGRELEWTLGRVPLLDNGTSREVQTGYVGDGKVGTRLSRGAYAAFVVGEIGKREWVRAAPMVCSA